MGFRTRLFISLLIMISVISSVLFFLHRESLRSSIAASIEQQSNYTSRLVDEYIQSHFKDSKELVAGKSLSDTLSPLVESDSHIAYLRVRRAPDSPTAQHVVDPADVVFVSRAPAYQETFKADQTFCIDTPFFRFSRSFFISGNPYWIDIAMDMREQVQNRKREESLHIVITLLLMLGSLGLGFWLFRGYITGIARLNFAVNAIEEGRLSHRIKLKQLNELKPTAEAFNKMADRLAMVASEQKSLYKDLLEKDRRLELILNNTEEGIIGLGSQLEVQIANAAALKMLGVDDIDEIHPATALMPEVLMEVSGIHKNPKGFHFEDMGVINTKGQKVPVEIRGSQLSLRNDEYLTLISMRNLTLEKRIRHAYEEENSLKAALMDASLDSILLLDNMGNNLSYNLSMFNLVNRLSQSHEDLNALQILGVQSNGRESIVQTLDRLELINTGIHSAKRVCPNGDVIHLEFNIQAFDAHGGLYYTLVVRDVTQKVKNQLKLEQAITEADAANVAKSQFLAAMSHEIRTPLNGIQGSISLLSHSPVTDDQKELLHAAEISSEALMQLINDILDFAKIEAGKMELETLEVSLQSVLKEAITIISPRANQKQLKIRLNVDESIDHCVLCDAGRLRQICLNLLSNAVKFTEQGSIELSITALTTDTDDQKISLRVMVQDQGIGIPRDKQAILFNEFTQANQTDSRRHGGTGLGLAISQKLAELMGGYILFSSEPDMGSCFALYLTLPLTETPVAMISQEPLTPHEKSTLRSGRILIVEDSITNQMIASRMLSSFNQQYEIASDGLEAVQAVQERPFDLILMDLQMPEMNGYEATEAIRKIPELNDTPIVAMTANVMTSDKERCFSVGMNDFLPKPVQMNALENLLYRWLGSESVKDELIKDEPVEAMDSDGSVEVSSEPAISKTESESETLPTNEDQPEILSLSAIQQMERDIGKERCLQMIEIVNNELKKRSKALYEAFDLGKGENVRHEAHTLKSTSASFGLLQLSDLSKQIEHYYRTTGEDNADVDIDALVKRLPEVLDIGVTALENYRDTLEVD
ncbi:ATP-binding protein [Oceanospirillum sanctuarii]|uniref:ATP-binding protein n=1 Tax=Oceanospirillum sanctuarii TaxID=1434821 RepID=UPI000A38BFA6|nr:ATP-binding protein [Oceanospirillum sanctuarii]